MFQRNDFHFLAILVIFQLLMYLAVDARGAFPVNDDWAYAHSVQWLLDEERIRLSDWIAMNLLPQTLAGGGVAWMFGFSFEHLRHLTQFVALATSVAAYYFFRGAGLSRPYASLATACLVSMPCWPVLSNSYMTDLYGLLPALISAGLFLRHLHRPSTLAWSLASGAAIVGVLERQVVLVIPFSFAIAWFWQTRRVSWRGLAIAVTPFAAAMAANALYYAYLALGPGVPEAQVYSQSRLIPLLVKAWSGEGGMRLWIATNVASVFGYLGLFSVGWIALWGMGGGVVRRFLIVAAAIAAATLLSMQGIHPPYLVNNIVDSSGIGPITLNGEMEKRAVAPVGQAGGIWLVAGFGATLGAVALAAAMAALPRILARRAQGAAGENVFLVLIVATYLAPFLVTGYFDRYLVFVLPFVFVIWTRITPEPRAGIAGRVIGGVWLACVFAASVAATHDYFSWNRVRWQLIHRAETLGASAETLDGGFEYNAYKRFEVKPRVQKPDKSFWWVVDDEYVVTLYGKAGYEVLERSPVPHWLPGAPKELLLLHRNP